MKKHLVTLIIILNAAIGYTQDVNTFFSKVDVFLNTYVADGSVAYSKIHSNPKGLNELMELAKTISISEADAKVYQAFWINAYNLAVIKGIVDNYPIASPLDKLGFFDKTKNELGGKSITLNDIENKLLRAKFNDARFHFVLVCGAVGCPPLINKAYLPNELDAQLEKQTIKALNGNFLRVNSKKKRVEISQIMEWYKEDFLMDGNEIDFINKYRKEKVPDNFKITYFTYNWKLNKQ